MTLLQYFQMIAYILAILTALITLYTIISTNIQKRKKRNTARTGFTKREKKLYYYQLLNDPKSTVAERKRATKKLHKLMK